MKRWSFVLGCLITTQYTLAQTYSLAPSSSQNGFAVFDTRTTNYLPQDKNMGFYGDFIQNVTDGLNDGGTYNGVLTFRQYGTGTDFSGGLSHQLGFTDNNNIWIRSGDFTSWGQWYEIWHSGNFNKANFINNEGQPYYQANTWLQFNGTNYGVYFPNSGSGIHLAPNYISSYGSFQIDGAKNGWTGILFGSANTETTPNLMFDNAGNGGFFYEASRWGMYYNPGNNYLAIGGTNNAASGSLYAGNAVFNGNVGIGTTNPQSLLSVNGTITGKQVTITQTGWPDFVFNKDYRLKPLSMVADYITRNNHLPGIPSAKEVEAKGLNLGEMQQKQMQKIEELTLYVIEQNEEMELQDQRIDNQEKENKELRNELEDIKKEKRNIKDKIR